MNIPPICVLDFETFSILDLTETGPFPYAEHPSSGIHVARYMFPDDTECRIWRRGEPFPDELRQWLDAGHWFEFHNALFEWALWNITAVRHYGWPSIPLEQISDTQARGLAMGFPMSLNRMAQAARLPVQKETGEGQKAMKHLMKPMRVLIYDTDRDRLIVENAYGGGRKDVTGIDEENERRAARGERRRPRPKLYTSLNNPPISRFYEDEAGSEIRFHEFDMDPVQHERMESYAAIDVHTQKALSEFLRHLKPQERDYWLLTMRSNIRGVAVDTDAARSGWDVVEQQRRVNRDRIREITNGAVPGATSVVKLRQWLGSRGIETDSLDKNVVQSLLASDVPDDVREALDIRAQDSKSSTTKMSSYINHTAPDGRLKGEFVYHGAPKTGRLTSRGVQLHNLPSRTAFHWTECEEMLAILRWNAGTEEKRRAIEMMFGKVIESLSAALRSILTATTGHTLYGADFSNIEGRDAAWLAGEQWKVEAFRRFDTFIRDENGDVLTDAKGEPRRQGHDLYNVAAGNILGIDPSAVSKRMRNALGKVSELSLQFQGGVGAFVQMAANYNVEIGDYWEILCDSLPERITERAVKGYEQRGHKSGIARRTWIAAEAVKLAWRERHPAIVQAWYDCEEAAINAIRYPGSVFYACNGALAFGVVNNHGQTFLVQRLPSGRCLFLSEPALKKSTTDWGQEKLSISYMGICPETGQWRRRPTYGGDLYQSCQMAGTPVLTDAGWLPIEEVEAGHKVWDGVEWASCNGAVYQGEKHIMSLNGTYMTPDHKVLTEQGWKDASSCEGYNRAACRLPDSYTVSRVGRSKVAMGVAQPDILSTGPGLAGKRPVYDILDAGPRTRYTILDGRGQPMIVHNCVQGSARDIMMNGWQKCTEKGFNVLLNVHDELAGEAPDDSGLGLDEFIAGMEDIPAWAAGMPVTADGFTASRFRKDD